VFWFILIVFACQVFYYEDETTTDFEVAKVTQSYNTGINKAVESSVRIDTYGTNGFRNGHGSGNAFKIGSKQFVITASHVVQDFDRIVIRERNGNMIPAIPLWANLDNDIAILLPLGEFEHTSVVSYVNNRNVVLDGKSLYFHGYPSDHDGLLIKGFVSKSDHSSAIAVELNPFTGMPAFIETIVVVNRFYFLSRKDILGILKDGSSKSWHPN